MNIKQEEVLTCVQEILVSRVGLNTEEVAPLSPSEVLFGDTSRLALDSVDMLELAMGLDRRFPGVFGEEMDIHVLESVTAITTFLNAIEHSRVAP
ncbi:MAG: hypothetical protein M1499_08700 [Firmicutes bacterium]|nr:hypothetical protein [Bacillota bacterium]